VLAELEKYHLETPDRPGARLRRPRIIQTSLFANSEDPVIQALRDLDLSRHSPEEVIAQVQRWQRGLGNKE